jgi:hypothetical protein
VTAHPKPAARKREPVKVFPDGRVVCDLTTRPGRKEYFRLKEAMICRQRFLCAICGSWLWLCEFDHEDGRGANGGHRDDRIVVDGEWHNAALCFQCNLEKGSKRYHWVNGKYIPKEK